MTFISLRAACAQCAALCCVALAFDRSPLFAIDKAAGEVCPNLSSSDRCSIHRELAEQGFGGCARYDCLGAGQRVTRMFAGRSWRDGPDVQRAMLDAFRAMRRVHELIQLLREAGRLPLSLREQDRRALLLAWLEAEWTAEGLRVFECSGDQAVMDFITSLRSCVTR